MTRPRAQEAIKISMFPFLAVLVCTMGALVVLLLIVARQARATHQTAQAAVVEQAAQQRKKLQVLLEDLAWRREQLLLQREQTAADLQRRRLELSHLEEHSRRLQEELAALRAAQRQLDDPVQADLDAMRRQLLELQTQIVEAEDQLRLAREQHAKTKPAYAIIPFQTRSGTFRRPIYLECHADRVILQPEGIVFPQGDFSGPPLPSNPLAVAVRAVRESLLQQQAQTGEPVEPYPLMLVRPDGIEMYYAARQALLTWGSNFGYELVDADWNLEFPPANAALAREIELAVAESRRRMEALAQSAPRMYAARGGTRFRAAPGGGGIIVDDGSPGYRPPEFGRSRTAGGARRFSSGEEDGSGRDGAGDDGSAAMAGRGAFPRSTAGTTGGGAAPSGSAAGSSGLTGDHMGNGGSAGDEAFGHVAGTPSSTAPSGTGQQGSTAPSGTAHGGAGQHGEHGAATSGVPQGTGPDGAAPHTSSAGDAGQHGQPLRATHGQSGSGSPALPNGPAMATRGTAMDGSGTPAAGPAFPNSSGTPAAGGGGPPTGPGDLNARTAGNPGGTPQTDDDLHHPPSRVSSLAHRRGQDWALPGAARGAIGITRPVAVRIGPQELTLLPEVAGQPPRTIALKEPTGQSVDEIVSALWDRVESWGIAGKGLYWRPVLSAEVLPGGQQRFDELATLLHGSGLELRAKSAQAGAVPPPRR